MKDVTFEFDKNPVKKDFLAYTKFSIVFFVIGVFVFIYAWAGRGGGGESGLAFIAVASQVVMILSFLVILFGIMGVISSFKAIKREPYNRKARLCLYINLTCLTCLLLIWLSIYGHFWFYANKRNNAFPERSRVTVPQSRNAAPKQSRPMQREKFIINTTRPLKEKPLPPAPRKDGDEKRLGTSLKWQPQTLKSGPKEKQNKVKGMIP